MTGNTRLPEEFRTPSEKRHRRQRIADLQREARTLEETMRATRRRWMEVTKETLQEIVAVGMLDDEYLRNVTSKFYKIYFKF